MICADCGVKMILKQVGIVSLGAGYECPQCGFRDGFHIYEIYENPSPELESKLDELSNIPIGLMENKADWLAEFDAVLDRQGITVYSQSKTFIGSLHPTVKGENDG